MSADEQRHGEGCACIRCVGFERGNTLAVRHGSYSSLEGSERMKEFADEIRQTMPVHAPCDEVVIRAFALVLVRVERAAAAIDRVDDAAEEESLRGYVGDHATQLRALRADLLGWLREARRFANDLGMTPVARARLGLDVALTRRALNVVELHAAADEEGS